MTEIWIQVTEEWDHGFRVRRPFRRVASPDDFVTRSDVSSEDVGELVWFYSWGNTRWLRCPVGQPGDLLNTHGDRISGVDVQLLAGLWHFVVTVEERS